MTHKRFKQIAEELLTALPAEIREKLGRVAIIVEDDPPAEDSDLMGVFVGEPYGEGDPALPNQIILYKNNIEAECEYEEDVPDEIRITLLHEIGHYLGLDEEDLYDRGLE
jgi:predicted Zn-dependent protease with MMP-like domain